MLGLSGVAVPLGFILCILSTLLCVVYGIMNWNKGYIKEEELKLEEVWKDEEKEMKKLFKE
ncbi:MAG: hypothetical protein GY714_31300 [Desulfobacterales bacterium]|nr:hypothetical protein [Desulfobacterales bacterium]MCP4159406.1 hypothetical protein [Deltaproteobacteria bacterium]